MRRIALSLVTILATVAMVAGATKAVFSASSSIPSNVLATATIDMNAHGEARGGVLAKPINVLGLIPGAWTPWYRGVVENKQDSTAIKVWMYVTDITGGACNKVNLDVRTGFASDGGSSELANTVYSGSLYGLNGYGNKYPITGYVFNPTLPAWNSAVIQQRAQLDPSADNSQMGQGCTWTEVFYAETP